MIPMTHLCRKKAGSFNPKLGCVQELSSDTVTCIYIDMYKYVNNFRYGYIHRYIHSSDMVTRIYIYIYKYIRIYVQIC